MLLVRRPEARRSSFELDPVLVKFVEVDLESDEGLLGAVVNFDQSVAVGVKIVTWAVAQEAEAFIYSKRIMSHRPRFSLAAHGRTHPTQVQVGVCFDLPAFPVIK